MVLGQILYLLLLNWSSSTGQFQGDPLKNDYCSLKCPEPDKQSSHTACGCPIADGVEEPLDDQVEFRQKNLDLHNYYRNQVATGQAAKLNPAVTEAANMNILKYDLELEFIARCLARRFQLFNNYHDSCNSRINGLYVGQNLAGTSHQDKSDWPFMALNGTDRWFAEINMTAVNNNLIEHFNLRNHGYGHFTQMIWAEAKYLGCAKAFDHKQNPKKRAWSLVSVCNYGGDKYGGNVETLPIYIKGKPCSQCPADMPCGDKKYEGLCGQSEPAPTSPPADIPHTIAKHGCPIVANFFIIFVCLMVVESYTKAF